MPKNDDDVMYLPGTVGDSFLLFKTNGIEVTACKAPDMQRALRLGALCLNTGKSDRDLFVLLDGLATRR